uniref:Uncharacterized protein n=1 Tax=Aegilops tauschii TaxID=37682 RepID=M8BJD4_AEGTA
MAGRLLGQLLVMGGAVVRRAVVQAYRQAIVMVEDIQQIGVAGSQFMESLVGSSSNATTRGWTL